MNNLAFVFRIFSTLLNRTIGSALVDGDSISYSMIIESTVLDDSDLYNIEKACHYLIAEPAAVSTLLESGLEIQRLGTVAKNNLI